ncbi:RNA polymerase factor sigma-54 [Runella sp.]|uniref:RNA polymerase factor sigma-54 n=1 Tax=Runella sp. TaxID=1960881 RepID=UPI003D127023
MLNLIQTQKQTLKISPAQIQLLNFLQLNTLELEQHIKNELEENPILEEGADDSKEEFDAFDEGGLNTKAEDRTQDYMDWDEFRDDDTPDYRTRINNFSDDDDTYTPLMVEVTTWRDELKEQFHLLALNERQQLLSDFVVDSLTDTGYLNYSAGAIADDVSFTSGIFVEEEEVQEIIQLLRKMDPPGLGAQDLQDCLLLQLERLQGPEVGIATKLIKNNFEDFAARNYEKMMKSNNLTSDQLKAIVALIGTLNPQPVIGSQTDSLVIKDNIVPDYVVTVDGDLIDVELNNRRIPPLKINKTYAKEVGGTRAANTYVNSKLNAANWLIEAIQQRENTMLKSMRTIVKLQEDYFKTGNVRLLKPMVLRDVAERISMDVSTISRVTSGKYAQTPFGVIHLKDLFTEGVLTQSGEEVSNRQIQLVLVELVSKEDKQHPFNDFQLAEMLADRGYPVARRTVAKYREQMDIQAASLRRVL